MECCPLLRKGVGWSTPALVEPDHWATLSQALLQHGPALPKGSELRQGPSAS